jgi:hypothetical protein
MQVMFDRVAGLDVGKETVTVCLRTPGPKGRRHAETRTFKTTTGSLHIMRDWLVEAGVTIAAMESTSTLEASLLLLGGGDGGVAAERRAHEGGAGPQE